MSSLTKLFTIPASHCSALYHGVSVIIPNTSPTTINRAHYIFGLSIILLTNLYEIFFHHVSSNGYPLLERPYWYSMDLLWMSKVLNGLAILAILTIAMKKKARLFYINSINVGDNRKKSAIRRQNGGLY